MVIEFCDIRVRPGQESAFEQALHSAAETLGPRIEGFEGYKMNRGIESNDRYLVQMFWRRLEDHTITFQQGPLFAEWLSIIGPFMANPPAIEHFELVG